MVRISKKSERRAQSPRKRHASIPHKTGPKKDDLQAGYKEHTNALTGDAAAIAFIPKIK